MTTQPICHLFIILARDVHQAVILRRGPHIWTQMLLWNTKTDTFTEGQWLKGTLYPRRCDLSPDGSKLIYFVAKHYKHNYWTAISRPPYFTALAMWDTSGTWH